MNDDSAMNDDTTSVATTTSDAVTPKVKVTIITGFLGSGKSTLLNHLLTNTKTANSDMSFAVIENELGDVSIDDQLLQLEKQFHQPQDVDIIEVTNGCLCCNVRGDLVRALQNLYQPIIAKGLQGVLIETTGLADPGPIVQTFFQDEVIGAAYELDGVVTVVDAPQILTRLAEVKPQNTVNEAVEQIAFADKIILNKTDLLANKTGLLTQITQAIHEINATAPILPTNYSRISPSELINLGGFDVHKQAVTMDPHFFTQKRIHRKDARVTSLALRIPGQVNFVLLEHWIQRMVQGDELLYYTPQPPPTETSQQVQARKERNTNSNQQHDHDHTHEGHDHHDQHMDVDNDQPPATKSTNLYRYKGILAVKGFPNKYVFQGVGMVFTGYFSQESWPTPQPGQDADDIYMNEFVFIGKDLNHSAIEVGFEECVVEDDGELRFPVGAKVFCNIGTWQKGIVLAHWDEGRPYRFRLEEHGGEVYAPVDTDDCIRKRVK